MTSQGNGKPLFLIALVKLSPFLGFNALSFQAKASTEANICFSSLRIFRNPLILQHQFLVFPQGAGV